MKSRHIDTVLAQREQSNYLLGSGWIVDHGLWRHPDHGLAELPLDMAYRQQQRLDQGMSVQMNPGHTFMGDFEGRVASCRR